MKSLVYNFLAALLILAVSFFTSCQSSSNKMEEANEDVAEAREDLQEAKDEAKAVAIKVATEEEWRVFKSDAEVKIKSNEIRIDELKVKMKKPGTNNDEMYVKNIESLEQKNKDLKNWIGTYETNQTDWESFKREFNHDMDELGQSLKDLTVDNKK